jgi:lysozyme
MCRSPISRPVRAGTSWTAGSRRTGPGVRRAGVPHGAYHFFSLCTPGLAQARNFLRVVPVRPGELAPALDLELSGNCTRPARRAIETQLKDYLQAVQRAMRQAVVIYLGDDFARYYHLPMLCRHPLWLRSILRRPPPGWIIWLVDGYAHIAGISGDVDLDVGRVPLPAARTWRTPADTDRRLTSPLP